MNTVILSGRANPDLARKIAVELGLGLGHCRIEDFPDGEIMVELGQPVLGADVFLVQPTCHPVGRNLLEVLLIADACRRAGAGRLTAILPYFGYARQDRREGGLVPVGAKLAADLLGTRMDRIIAVDLHNPAIEGFFAVPLEHLSALSLLANALFPDLDENAILVAPDLGAVKLAQHYGDRLGLPVAYIHKIRHSGDTVSVRRVIGSVKGRKPVIVDDMISTGGTIVSAARALLEQGCLPEITVAASHGLLVGKAAEHLAKLPIRKIVTTDSVRRPALDLPIATVGLGGMLAEHIRRLKSDIARTGNLL